MCMLCAMRLTTWPQSRRRLLDETALALRWAQCGGGSTGSCGLAAALARKVSAPLCVGRREHRRNSGTFTDYLESITSISRAPICSSDSIGKLNAEPASLTSSPRGKPSAIHSRLAVEIHEDWIKLALPQRRCCAIRHFVRRSVPQNRGLGIANAKPPISQRFSRALCSVFGGTMHSVG
jgi:hypothetical protein